MEHLYAPWRSGYFKEKQKEGCIFCNISQTPHLDLQNRVFYRDESLFCVMNKFPYTPGHFLIVPHFHTHSPEFLEEYLWLNCLTDELEKMSDNTYKVGSMDWFCRIDNTKYFKHFHKLENDFVIDKNGERIIDR